MSDCQTCADVARNGYCAPGRCYCGHPTCHAFASWSELPPVADTEPAPRKPARASSWDTREESTWIDSL